MKEIIASQQAPAAIGPYSQAVAAGGAVYLSGQIGLDPATGELVAGGLEAQLDRIFSNLDAVCRAAGGTLDDLVKLNLYLLDMGDFATVNELMAARLQQPYPARAAVQVSALPKGALIEIDGVMHVGGR